MEHQPEAVTHMTGLTFKKSTASTLCQTIAKKLNLLGQKSDAKVKPIELKRPQNRYVD